MNQLQPEQQKQFDFIHLLVENIFKCDIKPFCADIIRHFPLKEIPNLFRNFNSYTKFVKRHTRLTSKNIESIVRYVSSKLDDDELEPFVIYLTEQYYGKETLD